MVLSESPRGDLFYIIAFVFLLGTLVEVFYLFPVLTSDVPQEVAMERVVNAGIILSILIVLAIVLVKQNRLMERLRYVSLKTAPRTSREVRKELQHLYRDLGALKIVARDRLMKKDEYDKKKAMIDTAVARKKAELRALEKKERKPGDS